MIIAVGLVYAISSLTAQETIEIHQGFEKQKIGKYTAFLVDKSKELSIDQVIVHNQWELNVEDNISFPARVAAHWLKANVINRTDQIQHLLLNIEYAHLGEYQLFYESDHELIEFESHGDNYLFDKRQIKHPIFLHDLKLDPKQSTQIYLRIDQEGQDSPLPISIWDRSEFLKHDVGKRIFHGLNMGIIVLIILILMALFTVIRSTYVLIEIGVLFFSLMYVLAEQGYGMMYIWGNFPEFNGVSRPFSIGMVVILNLMFSIHILDFKESLPRLYRLSIWFVSIMGMYMLLVHPFYLLPLDIESNMAFNILAFLIMAIFLSLFNCALAIFSFRKEKNRDALTLILIYLAIAFIIAIRSFTFYFEIPLNWISQHGGVLGIVLHGVLIGAYIIYKSVETLNKHRRIQFQIMDEKRIAAESMLEQLNKERGRISMDIHDSLGSLVSALSMNLNSLIHKNPHLKDNQSIDKSLEYIEKIDEEMRLISHNLMPKTLENFGLLEEVKKLIDDVEHLKSIKFDFQYSGFQERLEHKIELELYRIIYETIDNISKHSKASEVLLQINKFEEEVNLIIEDNGQGFDPNLVKESSNGIVNLKNRIKLLNGEMDLMTEIGEGTSISLNIPLPSKFDES